MGQRTAIVTSELKDRLYDAAVRGEIVQVMDPKAWGDGTFIVSLVGDQFEGAHGHVQVILAQDGSFSFKPYTPDFWEC